MHWWLVGQVPQTAERDFSVTQIMDHDALAWYVRHTSRTAGTLRALRVHTHTHTHTHTNALNTLTTHALHALDASTHPEVRISARTPALTHADMPIQPSCISALMGACPSLRPRYRNAQRERARTRLGQPTQWAVRAVNHMHQFANLQAIPSVCVCVCGCVWVGG